MPPVLALALCTILVLALLRIEQTENLGTSIAVLIPTLWIMISASRPVGMWFQASSTGSFEEGSSYDRFVLSALIFLSLIIIKVRDVDWLKVLKDNSWLIVLLCYLGLSTIWSDHTFVSAKRWIRICGAVPVAIVILSEPSPAEAFVRILRRCSYVLVPFSILLVKYYPHLGRGYSRWSGVLMWHGVTLTKNALGQLCLMTVFILFWIHLFYRSHRGNDTPPKNTFGDILIFLMAGSLMLATPSGSYSATSLATLIIVVIYLLILHKGKSKATSISAIFACGIVLAWFSMFSLESFLETTAEVLGRDTTLTGRAEIWAMAFRDAMHKPILGTGFGGYFNSDNQFTRIYGNTGHNGLLDVFVETGIIGVLVFIAFLASFYRKARLHLVVNFTWGAFAFGVLLISLLTNYTESLFLKSSSYIWNVLVFISITLPSLQPQTAMHRTQEK